MAETSPLLESHFTASGSVVNVVPTSNTHHQHESTTIANGVTSPRVVTRSTKKHHRAPHSTHGGNPGPWTWAKWLHQGNMVGICRQSTITSFTMQLRQSSVWCLCICKELDFELIISSLYRFKALCRIPCQYSWHNVWTFWAMPWHMCYKLSGVWVLWRALNVLLHEIQLHLKLLSCSSAHTYI